MNIILISTSTTAGDQGIRTVSSCLKQEGHDVSIIFLTATENYKKLYSKRTLEQLKEICKDAQLIGISSYASTSKRAIQVINTLKQLNIPIVWGGVHATISTEECIKHCDIVCVGEGEKAVLELVEAMETGKDYSNIKNLWIRRGEHLTKNPVRELIQDIDKLPFPDYDINKHYILKRSRIKKFSEYDLAGYIFFLTGRGCPYSCTYCSNKQLNRLYEGKGRIVRWHSPEYIIRCIENLRSIYKSLKVFDIRDDTFSFRQLEQIREFCRLYKERIGLRFKCLGDPKTINEEKIRVLVDAGCSDIIIGIQGAERVNREIYQRNQTDLDVLKAASILNKYEDKLAVMYDVIACNPYETKEDLLNMIGLLMKIPAPYFLSVNNLVFFTGSALYNKAKHDGINYADKTVEMNYWDRWQHIKLKRNNMYLNLILNLMRGAVTERRFGLLPRSILKIMIRPCIVGFNLKHNLFTCILGSFVGGYDTIRENLAKPIYRNLFPTAFKVWYDKVRYRV
ncbi:B12-binding domain-containing radical SAM protein [archaeon]|nr:B12-binding domain-containing radical SAM protein [archaeon]